MDVLNFISWIKNGQQVTSIDPTQTLIPLGLRDPRRDDGYLSGSITAQNFVNSVVPPAPPAVVAVGTGVCSTVRTGLNNCAVGNCSTVFGFNNQAPFVGFADYATVSGGANNCSRSCAFVGGGVFNTAQGTASVITGGANNYSGGNHSVIAGGQNNETQSACTATLGGNNNDIFISSEYSTMLGGTSNCSTNLQSLMYGQSNTVSACNGTVLNGVLNIVSASNSSIIGGVQNAVSATFSGVLGGCCNIACNTATRTAILGGHFNSATCNDAFVVGSCIVTNRVCTAFVNNLSIMNIPTSSAGLPSKAVWSNAGVLTIVP
jgi:hypothetical protein